MEEIKNWLMGTRRDYQEGVAIFSQYCTNKFLVNTFARGNSTLQSKLEYEMKKLLGIPLTKLFTQTCSNEQLINDCFPHKQLVVIPTKPTMSVKQTIVSVKKEIQIPSIITAAKAEIRMLYSTIDKMHSELYELGTENDPDTIDKRRKILQKRKPLISKADKLYNLKEEYFRTDKIPDELTFLLQKETEKSILIEPHKPDVYLSNLTDIDLLKRKQAIASSITKVQNKLSYQAVSKLSEARPMPAGPLRDKTEKKLKSLKTEYKKVLKLIEERGKK